MNEASDPTPAAGVPPHGRALRRWLVGTALTFGLLVAAAVGLAVWLLRSEAGTAQLLARLPIVEVTAPHGALLGDRFGAERVRLTWAGGAGSVVIDGLELQGMSWRAVVAPGVLASLRAESMQARRVQVVSGPASSEPLAVPSTLRLPFELDIERVQVDELRVDALEPAQALSAKVHLGAGGGAQHRIESLGLDWDLVHVEGGQLQVAADAPFKLDTRLQVQSRRGTPWQATLRGTGPIEAIDAQAQLRGEAVAGRAAPVLDAKVQLRPFAAWPLGTVDGSTRGLDLSALATGLPRTQIDGQVVVKSQGANEPLSADLTLENLAPGRWDAGGAPLRRARLSVRGNPAQPQRIELPAFDIEFADAAEPAGRLQGQGVWDGGRATLESRLTGLRPQRLDGRAPALRVSGPLTLTARGLPSPDPRAAGAASVPASGAASAGAPGTAPGVRWADVVADFKGTLEGVVDGAPKAVSLVFDGGADLQQVTLRSVRATAGSATAQLDAQLQRRAGQRLQLRSQGVLDRFDPVPWLPGADSAAWRRGPHRLSANWKIDLALPESAAQRPPLQWLQTLQGDGDLRIVDSMLAGVPLQGQLKLQNDPDTAAAQRSHVQAEFVLGGNRLALDGRGDPLGTGEADRWRVDVQADTLNTLAPLAALDPALGPWAPRKGGLRAHLTAAGRWPALRTEGDATVQSLQAGELSLANAHARWSLDGGAARTIDLQAEVGKVSYGAQQVESARGSVRGTLAAHNLMLELQTPGTPPPVVERMLGLRTGAGTQLQAQGEGAWVPAQGGGGTWRGQMQRIAAGVWDGGSAKASDASWLDTRDLRGEVRIDAKGRVVEATTTAGRATLAGGIGLHWSDVRWRADTQPATLVLQAEVDPVAVAPLLQRARAGEQAGYQWSGDLRMGARIDVRAGDRFDAEISLQRLDGDLLVSDGSTPQALGLTDADVTLVVHDGLWRFTPRLAGRMLGTLGGAVDVRATPQQRWPGRDAPLEGTVQVQVPNLAVWAGFAPPGWRLEGELATTARLGGTFGAPEYTGELRAQRLGVRNLLQGVALSDGDIAIALKGDTAQIERFTLRGGDGTLTATGSANFGSAPKAQLAVTADHFRVLGRVDRQLVVSGNASLAIRPDKLDLTGKLGVDTGLFDLTRRDAPSLDEDVTIDREGPSSARAEPAPVSPMMRNASVSIDVDLGRNLRLRGRGLDTTLAGTLRVSTPGGRLAVNGSVQTRNGTYAAYGQKLEIERGVVILAGPLDTARLDILALRPNLDSRVGVSIAGTALNPRVRLYSDPEMSDTDKLSWLVLGRAPDGLGKADTALLQRAAIALLAGEGEAPTDSLMRAIGLDDISVRQSDGEVRETVITLGKQLSRRWYVGYERGVNATTGTWQLIYRIAQRFTLRAQSGLENSLDLIWTWSFDKL